MSLRETFLGRSGGKSLFQKWKEGWNKNRNQEVWSGDFDRVFNPLGLKPGQLVDLPNGSFKVESILAFQSAEGDILTRYSLAALEENAFFYLEAMKEGAHGVSYALFELADEFELDQNFIRGLQDVDYINHDLGESLEAGDEPRTVYDKEFERHYRMQNFSKEAMHETDCHMFGYFRKLGDGKEEFLSVDIFNAEGWISIFRGFQMRAPDIEAFGSQ